MEFIVEMKEMGEGDGAGPSPMCRPPCSLSSLPVYDITHSASQHPVQCMTLKSCHWMRDRETERFPSQPIIYILVSYLQSDQFTNSPGPVPLHSRVLVSKQLSAF